MKSKPTSFFSSCTFMFFLMLLVVLPSSQSLFAQQISPKILNFFQICAGGPHPEKPGEIFNEYQASFSISGFASDVFFKVQLSDATGSFTNPTSTIDLPALAGAPPDTATDKTLTFAVPTDLVGSNTYRLRVVSSTNVASTSFTISGTTSTKTFPAYYKVFSDSFSINNKQSSAGFCSGGSVTLSVDNPTPDITNSSPANYPQLKYKWYKDDVLIPGQTSSSLSNINVAGVYYAAIDYGLCTGNYLSQNVTVSGASSTGMPITSSLGNPFCSSLGNTTLAVSGGNSYVWKKDNVVIKEAISQTYETNQSGVYTCDVDFGGCKGLGTIDLKVLKTNSTISGVDVDKVNNISEGEMITATITSDAAVPSYQWFLNEVAIPGADKPLLEIAAQGKYKGVVTQTTGCIITDEFPFEVSFKVNLNVPKISNIITPNGDGVNDTWIIPDKYLTGTNTHISILSSLGEIVYQTDNYDNYNGWPQTAIEFNNFNPVYYYIITPTGESAKKGSITLVK
ncbi:gliding motility-associated C-terminal domain-containing protein [Flavobacterium granuli]|uniref:Gliding motility-associated-like protein n=1 Tax=Flavobacterium granuli TaxID=280093 RepID=A0ABU1S267_9FLAO|nr:gliding motility-associated C-terminal domain-containing protein [Flavobacterium granuli]MDR6845139.1 gliding motility-associated-like protein [Flavobacterium granuli]